MADETLDPLEAARGRSSTRSRRWASTPGASASTTITAIADVRQLPLPDDPETAGPPRPRRRPDHAASRAGEGQLPPAPRLDRADPDLHRQESGRRGRLGPRRASCDLGDLLGVDGTLGRTKTGELTVFADGLTFLGKCLLPPPEKWHGLTDVEKRSRQRYVDLFSNPESLQAFVGRTKVLAAFRRVLADRGFVEVETPDHAADRRRRGGAAVRHASQRARPPALPADRPRIAPEAAARRRHGARLRDRPRLPQRGDQPASTTPSSPCWRRTRPTATTEA